MEEYNEEDTYHEQYGVPILFYRGNVTPDKYSVKEVIFDKLMCISSEIDYFMKDILKKVDKIVKDGGFTQPKVYKFYLYKTVISIYDGLLNTDGLPCETYFLLEKEENESNNSAKIK